MISTYNQVVSNPEVNHIEGMLESLIFTKMDSNALFLKVILKLS